ncbi:MULTISPECIES: RidA family protein [Collinsella]|uniref:RidA family protein n=1 Tax=Collinsella TaxID=102106 RepID=UPI000B3773B2|nr:MULTISPECIES: RidA family protein [Collinsella]MBM6682428.1 RidA family protein [Collinsella intestinalis]OUN47017.1 reactive intermediate/imine deaminase [Collinsella sp. An7]
MSKTAVVSDQAPAAVGAYSAGISAGETVYLSGQLGLDPATGALVEGVEAQAAQALRNIGALLKSEGLDYGDVVKTTVLLANIDDFAKVNEVYATFFAKPYPARSCFAVAALPKGGLVEIEATAVRD